MISGGKGVKFTEEIKVTLVTALSLILIAVLFRNFIHKYLDPLVAIGPFYVFLLFLITNSQNKQVGSGRALIWNIIILLVTFLIILIYALK
jgi:hypothetical protein